MSRKIRTEIIINASKERVYEILTDLPRYPQWNPFVIKHSYFNWLCGLFIKSFFDRHHYFEIEEIGSAQVKLGHNGSFSGMLSPMILKKNGSDTRNYFIKMNQVIKLLAEAGHA